MKQNKHYLLAGLFLAVFSLSTSPTYATTAAAPAAGSLETTWQTGEVSTANAGKVLKKKTEKRGFFAKIKNFGKKAKLFFRAFASGEHNLVVALLLNFFLGGLGIHRVYLGGRPLLILLYLVTLGGFFGLLPLIDFIRLLIGQMDHYENNDSFFAAFQS